MSFSVIFTQSEVNPDRKAAIGSIRSSALIIGKQDFEEARDGSLPYSRMTR